MKNLAVISIALLSVVLISCSKEKKITRQLGGETWKVVKETRTHYSPNSPSNTEVFDSDITIVFEKDGTCMVDTMAGTYEVTAGVGEEEGWLTISTPAAYKYYKITEFSKKEMKLYDDEFFDSISFFGYVSEFDVERQ